jgi:hypothetical protein
MGIICCADADNRRRKNKCKKNFSCFSLIYAAPLTVTYNDKVEEKKEYHMVDIK